MKTGAPLATITLVKKKYQYVIKPGILCDWKKVKYVILDKNIVSQGNLLYGPDVAAL